jgi:hypothetical protein
MIPLEELEMLITYTWSLRIAYLYQMVTGPTKHAQICAG